MQILATTILCAVLLPRDDLENLLFNADVSVGVAYLGLSNEFIGHKLNTYCDSLPPLILSQNSSWAQTMMVLQQMCGA